MGLVRTVLPTAFVSLDQAKLHLRVDADNVAEDTLIASYAAAAVDRIEGHLERPILLQTWLLTLDQFPIAPPFGWPILAPGRPVWPAMRSPLAPMIDFRIRLPRPSLIDVVSLNYIDATGTPQTLDPAAYTVDTTGLPGSVSPAYGTSWPATYPVPNAVQITFDCGFSDDPALVPPAILAACLLDLGDLYTRREPGAAIDGTVCNLLAQYVYREAV